MIDQSEMVVGQCYWVVVSSEHNSTIAEADKFQLVRILAPNEKDTNVYWSGIFASPKGWKRNKSITAAARWREYHFNHRQIFKRKMDACMAVVDLNWKLSQAAARIATKYEHCAFDKENKGIA